MAFGETALGLKPPKFSFFQPTLFMLLQAGRKLKYD
jgi:hypothetical protein